jgi:hypothetical protein
MSVANSREDAPTDARIEAIRQRLNAATPGQWRMLDGWGPFHVDGRHRAARIGTDEMPVFSPSGPYGAHDIIARKEDFEFVAYAAGDVAWLLDELARTREDNERLRSIIGIAESTHSATVPQVRAFLRAALAGEPPGEK